MTDVNEIRRMHTQSRNTTSHMADTRNKSNNNNNSKERHNRNSNASSNTLGNNNEARQTHTQNRQSDTHNRNQNMSKNDNGKKVCKYCNYSHQFGTKFCPAYGKKCNECSKSNHFSSVCKLKNISTLSACNDLIMILMIMVNF